jgi:hypothetical protein
MEQSELKFINIFLINKNIIKKIYYLNNILILINNIYLAFEKLIIWTKLLLQ